MIKFLLVFFLLFLCFLSSKLLNKKYNVKLFVFHCRSDSPSSSHRSSPPISPGCEEQQHQQHIGLRMDFHDEFKKPIPPHSPIRPQDFQLYAGGHPYQLLAQGGSAFHRPLDPSGKPIPVSIQETSL